MSRRNLVLFSALAAVILMSGLFFSFYRLPFSDNTPRIVLPEETLPGQSVIPPSPDHGASGSGGQYHEIQVSPKNVQSVIASLSRPVSYIAQFSVTHGSALGSLTRKLRVFKSGELVKIEQSDADSNPEKYTLIAGGRVYVWRAGDSRYFSGPQGDISIDDASLLPTYEDILSSPPGSIQSAGLSQLTSGGNCLFTEISDQETGYLWRYDVSLDTGLLAEAEAYRGEQLIYKMSTVSFSAEAPGEDVFMLPDGRRVS